MFEAQRFIEGGGFPQHGGGLQIAALVTQGASLGQRLQHQPPSQAQPSQGGQEVHLLQLAHIRCPRQRRYAAPAKNCAVRSLNHPVAAALPLIGLVEKIEVGIRHAIPLVGGEAVFGGDGAHHGGDPGIVGRGDGADDEPLLAAGAGEGAAIEPHALPDLLALGGGELGQGPRHGLVHLPVQLLKLCLARLGEARLLAAPVRGVGLPGDQLPLGEAGQGAAGVGLVDAKALGKLLVGGGTVLQLDEQVGLQGAQGQRAALLGEHAEFAYQFPRQGAQGAGIHGVVSL